MRKSTLKKHSHETWDAEQRSLPHCQNTAIYSISHLGIKVLIFIQYPPIKAAELFVESEQKGTVFTKDRSYI